MKQRILVSVVKGPKAAEDRIANSDALVKVNGNYLHLNEEDLLTLTRLIIDSGLEDDSSGLLSTSVIP